MSVELVRAHAIGLRADAEAVGPVAGVPTCPGWTVQELVAHLGRVQGWAAEALRATDADTPPRAPNPPAQWPALLTWWDDQLGALLDELAAATAAPDRPTWNFSADAPRVAGFWVRRMAHETALHRLDVALAAGGEVTFEAEHAVDGVDEVLEVILPTWVSRGQIPETGVVQLVATDVGCMWTVRLRGTAPPQTGIDTEPDAEIVGPATALYRTVWGRPSAAQISGDTELAAALRGR